MDWSLLEAALRSLHKFVSYNNIEPLPLLHQRVCVIIVGAAAEKSHVSVGDRVLEVNGVNVRGLGHHEAGQLIAECSESVDLLLHTRKPRPVPSGSVIHRGWLGKKGGSGITPRNWRRRWFVLRDDCIAYYYSSPEVMGHTGCIYGRVLSSPHLFTGHTCPWCHCPKRLHYLQGNS